MLGLDGLSIAQNSSTAHGGSKLSDVSWPSVGEQIFDGGIGKLAIWQSELGFGLTQKQLSQQQDIGCTVGQRRNFDGEFFDTK